MSYINYFILVSLSFYINFFKVFCDTMYLFKDSLFFGYGISDTVIANFYLKVFNIVVSDNHYKPCDILGKGLKIFTFSSYNKYFLSNVVAFF